MKLTLAVYKVIALFPIGEDLGMKIRESADKILADLLLNRPTDLFEQLDNLFSLAEEKHWVDSRNFLVLRREYDRIRLSFEASRTSGKTVDNSNNHRHDKIIEAINGNGKVKIGEIVSLFPGLNRRTVLRDLDKLCQTGVMVRSGNGRGAYYIKNGHKCDTTLTISG